MQTQGGDPVGWAIGRVALWGRVIEHEKGWRAQYAYPYALHVESEDEAVALAVRRVYAVDVEWAGPDLTRTLADKVELKRQVEAAKPDVRSELKILQGQLKDLATELEFAADARQERFEAAQAKREEEQAAQDVVLAAWAKKHPLPAVPPEVTDTEMLAAFVASAAVSVAEKEIWRSEYPWHQEEHKAARAARCIQYAPSFRADDVVDALLILRGAKGPGGTWLADSLGKREGRAEWHTTTMKALSRMIDDDLIEREPLARYMPNADYYRPTKRFRLTRKAVRALKPSPGQVSWEERRFRGDKKRSHTAPLQPGVTALRRTPVLFEDEAHALVTGWLLDARAARRAGRKAYAEWLTRWRLETKRRSVWHDLFTVDVDSARHRGRVEEEGPAGDSEGTHAPDSPR
jgi:hypothetical protein